MKTSNIYLAVIAAGLISGTAAAGPYTDRQSEDIVYGKGISSSSPSQSYASSSDSSQDNRDDQLNNLERINPAAGHAPYERLGEDRDNREDLIDNMS